MILVFLTKYRDYRARVHTGPGGDTSTSYTIMEKCTIHCHVCISYFLFRHSYMLLQIRLVFDSFWSDYSKKKHKRFYLWNKSWNLIKHGMLEALEVSQESTSQFSMAQFILSTKSCTSNILLHNVIKQIVLEVPKSVLRVQHINLSQYFPRT